MFKSELLSPNKKVSSSLNIFINCVIYFSVLSTVILVILFLLLGLYISESEGANYWLSVLTDLHNRGVSDILIACVDGLKGFPEAIATIYPDAEVQECVIHQIRNSMKYVGVLRPSPRN